MATTMRSLGWLSVASILAAIAAPSLADETPSQPAARRVEQAADLLGVRPLLAAAREAPSGADPATARLVARDKMLVRIQRLSLQVDGALARVEREQFETSNSRQNIEGRSGNRATTFNLVAVLVGSGTTAVGTALQFGNTREIWAGYGIIIGGALISAGFTIAALIQKERGKTQFDIRTNLLAPLFDRPPANDESRLPEPVWRYLDAKREGQPASFRQQLLERFTGEGRISLASTPTAQRTIDLLARPISRGELVAADALAARADMLNDLRSRIASMKLDLDLLTSELDRGEE
jgi:hypothetical protein